jgi:DNA repair protein RadC
MSQYGKEGYKMIVTKYKTCLVRENDFMDAYNVSIHSPEEIREFCEHYIYGDAIAPDEQLYVIALNCRRELIGFSLIGQGGLTSASVEPRSVYRFAINANAAGIILVHNHPGGNAEPSNDDIRATERIVECGKILGIKVVDHVIIGDFQFSSFRALGYVGEN